MGSQEAELLSNIAEKTQSDLILFFIIVIVAMILVLLPLYALMMKDRKEKHAAENIRQDKYIEREKEIIKVITANTEVMSGLKATLETSGAATHSSLNRIHARIDHQGERMNEVSAAVGQMHSTLDRIIGNQNTIIDGINKTLLIVDNLPHNSNFGKGGLHIAEKK